DDRAALPGPPSWIDGHRTKGVAEGVAQQGRLSLAFRVVRPIPGNGLDVTGIAVIRAKQEARNDLTTIRIPLRVRPARGRAGGGGGTCGRFVGVFPDGVPDGTCGGESLREGGVGAARTLRRQAGRRQRWFIDQPIGEPLRDHDEVATALI